MLLSANIKRFYCLPYAGFFYIIFYDFQEDVTSVKMDVIECTATTHFKKLSSLMNASLHNFAMFRNIPNPIFVKLHAFLISYGNVKSLTPKWLILTRCGLPSGRVCYEQGYSSSLII